MAKIAYILLCHKDPDAIVLQARRMTAVGDFVAIHFDARAPAEAYGRILDALGDNPRVVLAPRRIKCGWGSWSLVEASLIAARVALAAFPRATHFYMVSGDCMPVKSAEYAHAFLDREDCDYIECNDFFASDWIKTGFKEERLIYRHWFNERTQRRLFYASYEMQRRLGLTRRPPAGVQIMIGSQWWCLRRASLETVMTFCDAHPEILRFFSTTWIPDETFFQTIVHHVIPRREIRSRTLTFLIFSDYGMPASFYNDHYDLLVAQDFLFARKISPGATALKARLAALYAETGRAFPISDEGRRLFHFLTTRGRHGRRFAARFWERDGMIGQERELLILACKKWHVAKRLLPRVAAALDVPGIAYLFNEIDTDLPNLGGIEGSMDKRHRHRRAVLKMLFDHFGARRMVICIDTAEIALLEDVAADDAQVRVLEIDCTLDDAYLEGHARRVGLASDATPPATLAGLLPALRSDIAHEAARIRSVDGAPGFTLSQSASPETNAQVLASFLSVRPEQAADILSHPHLFSD